MSLWLLSISYILFLIAFFSLIKHGWKIKYMIKSKYNFSQALEALKNGSTIYRAIERPDKYCKCTTIIEGKESYHIHHISTYASKYITFTEEDVLAEDWIID